MALEISRTCTSVITCYTSPNKMADDQNFTENVSGPTVEDFTGICIAKKLQSPEKSSTVKCSPVNLPPELSTRFRMVHKQ